MISIWRVLPQRHAREVFYVLPAYSINGVILTETARSNHEVKVDTVPWFGPPSDQKWSIRGREIEGKEDEDVTCCPSL